MIYDNNIIEEINARLCERADTYFPDMEFQPYKGGWRSRFKADGTPPKMRRADKCVIFKSGRLLENGEQLGRATATISLFDYYLQRKGKTGLRGQQFAQALQEVAREVGLELPEQPDSESWKAYRKSQDTLETCAAMMARALREPESQKTLSALQGTDYANGQRGFSDDFISLAQIGACTPQAMAKLAEVLGEDWGFKKIAKSSEPYFAIPYRSGSRILGFTFRSIYSHSQCAAMGIPKVINAFASKTATKQGNLFGLRAFHVTDKRESDYKALIVEGEIDALRAEWVGAENVMAMTGSSLSVDALLQAKRMGIKAVTLLFDTEATPESQQATDRKTEAAIQTALSLGLEAFVSSLKTDDWGGEKIDADSFLRTHSPEQFLEAVKANTHRASEWMFARVMQPYDGVDLSSPEFGQCRRAVAAMCQKFGNMDREIIYHLFSDSTGGYLSDKVLEEEVEAAAQERLMQQQAESAKSLSAQLSQLAKEGKTQEAIQLASKISDLADIAQDTRLKPLLSPQSLQQVRQKLRERPESIHTGYYLDARSKDRSGNPSWAPTPDTEILLPASALTFIGAPTSHGKTTFLQNLALRTVQNSADGDVVFITYEEPTEDVITEFLTLYAGEEYSANPVSTVRHHLATGALDMFRGSGHDKEERAKSLDAKSEEFDRLLASGRLRVYQLRPDLDELTAAINFLNKNINLRAVYVDYVQRLHKAGSRGSRKEEMQQVCDALMEAAVKTKLPIILGAQVNRETPSPVEMTNQEIADASDIEHAANTILLLWNSSYRPHHRKSSAYNQNNEPTTARGRELQSRGLQLGQEGKLYVCASKNRGGARGLDGIFLFNPRTRRITSATPGHGLIDPDTPLGILVSSSKIF